MNRSYQTFEITLWTEYQYSIRVDISDVVVVHACITRSRHDGNSCMTVHVIQLALQARLGPRQPLLVFEQRARDHLGLAQ